MYNLPKPSIVITALSLIGSAALLCLSTSSTHAEESSLIGLGTTPSAEEIAGWDTDIRPDGHGLPDGEGDFSLGETIYDEKCSVCHGIFGEGEARWPKLAGGDVSELHIERSEKTIGSYWPYATTIFDYINRAMPFHQPHSLSNDEIYALTGYLLYLNDLVDDDYVANRDFVIAMNDEMPNRDGFIPDDRPDTNNTRCMVDCIQPHEIVVQSEAAVLKVTPEDGKEADVGNADLPPAAESAEGSNTSLVSLSVEDMTKAAMIYNNSCGVCHNNGVAGAPKLDDLVVWQPRIEKGLDMLHNNAINGINAMPPKGGNTSLSDEDVMLVVDYMIAKVTN